MKKKTSPDQARMIIEELGVKKIKEELSVAKSTVSNWKRLGMPFWIAQHLKAEYPGLFAWRDR